MKKAIWIAALLGGALMAQNGPLANGVYAIEERGEKAQAPVTRQYEGKTLTLDAANFAPLAIAGKPVANHDAGQSWLEVQLTPEAAKRLAALTRAQMNRPIAVVIGDKIHSAPTVRSVIANGKARITPCDGDACETLIRDLSK